jgi:hypothetical protein
MSDLIINLDELHAHHEIIEEHRLRIFEDILKTCHNKIRKYNTELKKQECLFEPPPFIIGKPPYNYVEMIDYLIKSLRKNGLRTDWLSKRKAIYISWRKQDVDMEQYRSQVTTSHGGHHIKPYWSYADPSRKENQPDQPDQQQDQQNLVPFPVVSVPARDPKKKKTVHPQHLAMLEYFPGAKDFVPINLN